MNADWETSESLKSWRLEFQESKSKLSKETISMNQISSHPSTSAVWGLAQISSQWHRIPNGFHQNLSSLLSQSVPNPEEEKTWKYHKNRKISMGFREKTELIWIPSKLGFAISFKVNFKQKCLQRHLIWQIEVHSLPFKPLTSAMSSVTIKQHTLFDLLELLDTINVNQLIVMQRKGVLCWAPWYI